MITAKRMNEVVQENRHINYLKQLKYDREKDLEYYEKSVKEIHRIEEIITTKAANGSTWCKIEIMSGDFNIIIKYFTLAGFQVKKNTYRKGTYFINWGD